MAKTGFEAISVACAVNIIRPVGTTTAKPARAHVQLDVSMGVLVAGLQDGAGERHLLAGVVAAPPVMAERRAGERGHHGHGERESQSDAHVLPRFQFALTSEGLRRPATVKPSPRGLRASISPSVGKRSVRAVMLTWCVMRTSV